MRSPIIEASPDFSDGVMLALYLDAATATALTVDGGLPPDDMHVTVAYLGHASDVDAGRLKAAADRVVNRAPVRATISGHARFTGGDKGDVIVALVDSPDLERLRRDVVDALDAEGVDLPGEHGYCAHATLSYVGAGDRSPVERVEPRPVTFGALAVVHGTDRVDLPFIPRPDALRALAREAYAQGWALSGGPMTDRVKAGCVAAMGLACEHADDPHVLEATLHLGHLEGVWARIFERRGDLHAQVLADLRKTWRPVAQRLDAAGLVRAVREHAGLAEADDDTQARQAAATSLALTMLRGMAGDRAWPRLREAARNAIAWGRAEGVTDALALAADAAGRLGFGYDAAFRDAYTALDGSEALWSDADQWLADTLGVAAKEVGRLLNRMAAAGATAADMLTTATGLLDGADLNALTLGADVLVSRAVTAGVLDLYGRAGIDYVDFVTAGTNVCQRCLDLEQASPYPRADVPQPGIHPHCHCTLTASTRLPADLYTPYLT